MKKYIYILLISLFSVTGCDEIDYPTPTPSVAVQTARLFPINTVVAGNALDVTVDNVSSAPGPLVNDLVYAQNVGYKAMPAGANRLVEFVDAVDASVKLADRFTATASSSYTSFYYTTNPANAAAVRRITDNLTAPDVGFAGIRFLHFAKDAGSLRVTTVGGGTEVFSSRAYAALGTSNAFTNFTAVTSGTTSYEVRDGSNTVVFTIDNINLQSKKLYTIYARGLVADASLTYSVLTHN